MRIKAEDRLRVHWSKEECDLMAHWPTMVQGSSDASWLFGHVFTEEARKELTKRGWDITTLRFSIAPKLGNPTRPERFKKLMKKYNTDNTDKAKKL